MLVGMGGHSLYHWTHLELARYFGQTDLLSPATADATWERGIERLADPEMSRIFRSKSGALPKEGERVEQVELEVFARPVKHALAVDDDLDLPIPRL